MKRGIQSRVDALRKTTRQLPTGFHRGATDDPETCSHPSSYIYVAAGVHANGQHWRFAGCTACGKHLVNSREPKENQ